MSTNANVFNSRVTSEALEAKYRQVFPAQAGAELIQDLYASGVIQPVIDFSSVAEGSVLAQNLQTAWDFSTGNTKTANTTSTLITNTGFWLVNAVVTYDAGGLTGNFARLFIDDGATTKNIWGFADDSSAGNVNTAIFQSNVVFLRSGDSLKAQTNATKIVLETFYRQIADVNGNLVNPLGFTFS